MSATQFRDLSDDELTARSESYYAAVKTRRDPALLNRQLDDFLQAA